MIDNPVTIIKDSWRTNKLGAGMFTVGTVLCVIGVTLSTIWRLNFISISDNVVYVVTIIGIGIPFMLAGIGVLLRRPQKSPTCMMSEGIIENYTGLTNENYARGVNETYIVETHENYIDKNEILIIELIVSFLLVVLLFASYPDGWDYPKFYVLALPYAICLFLLTINILSNINDKEIEISCIRKEVEHSDMIIKEKEEMCKDNSAPDYTTDFAKKLNRNIDELKTIMDELKIGIDIGTKDIAERTAMVANKYKSDNDRLHNDLNGFKQRTEKEKIELKERANERVIKSLMNMLHDIDDLGKYRDKDASYTVSDIGGIKENIYDIIKNEGVDIINPSIGDNFDDKKCCAITTVDTDKFPGNKIVDIKKIGCMFKSGKVINYADVVVSKSNVKIEDNTKIDTKVDTKVDAKVDAKVQIEVIKMNTKVDAKTDDKTNTKTFIQYLIEYIETIIRGKADNDEQNKKDDNKKDDNKKVHVMPEFKKKDDNNEVRIVPEFKKKGD
jgi:molecular chaperone GrpE (heat shock protein)